MLGLAAIALIAGLTFAAVQAMGARHLTVNNQPPDVAISAPSSSLETPTEQPPIQNPAVGRSPLTEEFSLFARHIAGRIGVVIQPVDLRSAAIEMGSWERGPAWSTIKVPLAIAAMRESGSNIPTDDVRAAITKSSNEAAEGLWATLGDPADAAEKVQAVLGEAGDPPTVPAYRIRPEFSAFGQTAWSLTDQARFAAVIQCDVGDEPVLALMGEISPDQSWGLGRISGALFKGGWGPDTAGQYLVRQIGVIPTNGGALGVAIASQPDSGAFADGVDQLNEVAVWLANHLDEMPAGRCDA